jgi:hypothetical protein
LQKPSPSALVYIVISTENHLPVIEIKTSAYTIPLIEMTIMLRPMLFCLESPELVSTAKFALAQIPFPAISDAVLVGEIDDSDEAFQKIGRTGRQWDLVSNPRGIIYTTPVVCEAAVQALTRAAAEAEVAATATSRKLQVYPADVDLSWPTIIHAKCKKMAQHKLYNEGVVDVPCTCFSCAAKLTIPIDDDICNCSGCIPETIPPIPKPPTPPTVLSTIPHSDRISAQA